MKIYDINEQTVSSVARLMSTIKPDWWDYEGAFAQLSDAETTAKPCGWFLGETARKPVGWIFCMESEGYSCLSIENLSYDDNGLFVMEEQLEPLLDKAESYACSKGLRILKYVISSVGLSCHDRPLGDYADELRNLKSCGRKHFDYFLSYGFKPAGFLPNCYGKNVHGIIMVKEL